MFRELDTIVLNQDITDLHLKKGDLGTVVHIYEKGQAMEIEVVRADGKTVGVFTATPNQIRPLAESEILRVRDVATVS